MDMRKSVLEYSVVRGMGGRCGAAKNRQPLYLVKVSGLLFELFLLFRLFT